MDWVWLERDIQHPVVTCKEGVVKAREVNIRKGVKQWR